MLNKSKEVAMKCELCQDSGLLPFLREDGSIVPHAKVYCSCHQEQEMYQSVKPSDFDFACSNDFRQFQYNYCGIPDPCAVTVNVERIKETVIERQPANLEHVRVELNHMHKEMMGLRAEKKKPELKF